MILFEVHEGHKEEHFFGPLLVHTAGSTFDISVKHNRVSYGKKYYTGCVNFCERGKWKKCKNSMKGKNELSRAVTEADYMSHHTNFLRAHKSADCETSYTKIISYTSTLDTDHLYQVLLLSKTEDSL